MVGQSRVAAAVLVAGEDDVGVSREQAVPAVRVRRAR